MWLRSLHEICHFTSIEKKVRTIPAQGDQPAHNTMEASASELKRWLQQGAVVINGEKVAWDEPMDFPIHSVVIFPKRPITLW